MGRGRPSPATEKTLVREDGDVSVQLADTAGGPPRLFSDRDDSTNQHPSRKYCR
ncbi:hypothetical protein TIFTF001_030142 [Ficus carica]|uniref:Uncharacterized protein n=1 Tax=Ficus carica TaxID=3494 RepID=A0AA88J4F9_FICCA|nr:hypothetical protein TIFTF001_030142 [Ficus carica]